MQRLLESGGLQAKLRVSQPGDADEQEADRAAEQCLSSSQALAPAAAQVRLRRFLLAVSERRRQEPVIHRTRQPGRLRSFPLSIQRQAATPTPTNSHRAAADEADTSDQAKHPGAHPRTLIVEDDAPSLGAGADAQAGVRLACCRPRPAPRPMRCWNRSDIRPRAAPTSRSGWSTTRTQDAQHLTRAMHKYAPETVRARSAHEAIALVNQRVERAALSWAKTGKVTDLPEGIQEEMARRRRVSGSGAGFAHSGFGSALLGFIGGGRRKRRSRRESKVQRKDRGTEPGRRARCGGGERAAGIGAVARRARAEPDVGGVRV